MNSRFDLELRFERRERQQFLFLQRALRHCFSPHVVPQKKIVLENDTNRCCRFCHKCAPDVTFKKKAHAVPESLGNSGLISLYECDACNDHFGRTIENDLGEWALPMRIFTRIRGKRGVPRIKKNSDNNELHIEYTDEVVIVKCHEESPAVKVDEANGMMTFRVPRGPYRPVAVYKAFVKVALSLLPEDEVSAFRETLDWVREEDHAKQKMNLLFVQTEEHGPTQSEKIFAQILRRKPGCEGFPYAFLILAFGNFVLQVMIPSAKKDACLSGSTIKFPAFPTIGGPDPERYGRAISKAIDMSNSNRISDIWEKSFKFDQIEVGKPPLE